MQRSTLCATFAARMCWPALARLVEGNARRVARRRDRSDDLADLAKRQLQRKIPQPTGAPIRSVQRAHYAFLTRMHLDLIDQHAAAIEALTERIEVVMEPFRRFRDLICTHPRHLWIHR